MSEFVHLHLHTEFSLLDGACRIDELLDEAVRQKMPAIAVTEHGNMFSSVIFHDHARARGLNPILGCEVNVVRKDASAAFDHLVLLAANKEGYQNLIRLVSEGHLRSASQHGSAITATQIAERSKGLIALTGCLGGVAAQRILGYGTASGATVLG